MSEEKHDAHADTTMICCASCGIAQKDDIKLKKCTACYLVRYCSINCQRNHRPKHKRECKKRAAELRDEILYKQPESSHMGDCPICCLPLPIGEHESALMACCSKRVCYGCGNANKNREVEGNLQQKCPFCRNALPLTEEGAKKQWLKRVEANDPVAICIMGTKSLIERDYKSAFEYWTKAATLGDALAHYQLSIFYRDGQGVEKDEKKELHHLKEAAIGGHPSARHNLGCFEGKKFRMDRAVKHYIIAAKLGYDKSLESVKTLYKAGYVSKDDFAAALRGYQAAIDLTKSPQREEAVGYTKWLAERLGRDI